jgi:ABC-type amino acid transport substrate-binding protein
MKHKTIAKTAVTAFAALALLSGCAGGQADTTAPSTAESADKATSADLETVKPGVLTIVTSSDLTPFAYIKDNEWAGVDVALVHEVADNLGLTVDITARDFDTLVPLVATGQADLTMGSLADTDKRRATVDFVLPDIIGNNALVVPKGSKIKEEDDIVGKTVGILQSSQALEYATKYWTESNIVTFPSNNAARLALSGGTLDAILVDPQSGKLFSDQFPMSVAFSAVNPEDRGGAWPINKEAVNLRVAINEQLRELLADGTIQKILEEWNPADPSEPVIKWLEDWYAAHPSNNYPYED